MNQEEIDALDEENILEVLGLVTALRTSGEVPLQLDDRSRDDLILLLRTAVGFVNVVSTIACVADGISVDEFWQRLGPALVLSAKS